VTRNHAKRSPIEHLYEDEAGHPHQGGHGEDEE
jgi:hypothetical protein